MSKSEWERQTSEMEKVQKSVEGDDDRDYSAEMQKISKKVQ